MKILFCNIAYMNQYTGNIEDDIPQGGGAWVQLHKDAHEKWNFLNVNGSCYGFVMNKSDQFHIERLEGTSTQAASTSDVTVVWCAPKPSGDTVIVGWYEHATVYRYYQNSIVTPMGLDRCYFTKANADDCYLLPENKRTYIIGRASKQGMGTGFGQSNFWYADSEHAKTMIIPDVLTYLHDNRGSRINIVSTAFEPPENADCPLSAKEKSLADEYYNNNEYLKYLPLGYRAFNEIPSGDHAYFIATTLRDLDQYSAAVDWFYKAVEIEGDCWDTLSNLPYLLTECERFDEAIAISTRLLTFPQAADAEVKHELYGSLADNHYYLGKITDAISWLDKILSETKNPQLIEHTKQTRTAWMSEAEINT